MLALLSDLHANLHALRACLAHARAQGALRFAVLGDLVGYGAQPREVVDAVMALAREGAVVLRGNHDEAALATPSALDANSSMQDASAGWTHGQLSAAQRDFLAALPVSARLDDALLVHASAHDPASWPYVDHPVAAERCLQAAAVTQVFCGHVHHQRLFYQGRGRGLLAFAPTPGIAVPLGSHRQWLATVGSVGQPRDGDPRAMYALFDAARRRLRFERVPYAHAAAGAAIRQAGLPAAFAERVERGL
jgi:diadenosine tetraphosphatase ApaH/serine/threonine PP2A family protein phosphatase